MYKKDFDGWNEVKKKVNAEPIPRDLFYHEREIWWCSLGINIGSEIDGKHTQFERPVLILKKFNRDTAWALPMTRSQSNSAHSYKLTYRDQTSCIVLPQLRLISTSRLTRRVRTLSKKEFEEVKEKIIAYIKNDSPP